MGEYFKGNVWERDKLPVVVKEVVDDLVKNHPLLGHFREYLSQNLPNGLKTVDVSAEASYASVKDATKAVQEFVKGKIGTTLLLNGSYDSNSAIYDYLPTTRMTLGKPDVMQAMS